jgi:hypothetical protein
MFILIVVFALLIVMAPPVDASEKVSDTTKSETGMVAAPLPSDEQLDALLAARNWDGLVTAFEGVKSDESLVRALDWLDARINSGGGFLLAFLNSRFLWDIDSVPNVNNPDKDPRFRAGLMVLYTLQLIIIDGTKCADQSAPGHRIDQLLEDYGPVIAYLKTKPAKFKAKVIDAAITLEKRTASLRKDDDVLCRGGLEEMRASKLERPKRPPLHRARSERQSWSTLRRVTRRNSWRLKRTSRCRRKLVPRSGRTCSKCFSRD